MKKPLPTTRSIVSFALLSLPTLLLSSLARSQTVYPVHPGVAPPDTNFVPSANFNRQSPHFNLQDQEWNLGESLMKDPTGTFYYGGSVGYGGNYPTAPPLPGTFSTQTSIGSVDVPPWRMAYDWTSLPGIGQGATVFQGYLQDPANPGSATPHEAAFYVAYPTSWFPSPPSGDAVLIVHFLPTVAPHASTTEPLAERYPYWSTVNGLPSADLPTANQIQHAGRGYAEVLIAPRTSGHPFWSEVQRGIESVGLARDLLREHFGDPNFEFDAVIAYGGSVGGAICGVATEMFPNIFHAAISLGAPPEPWRYLHAQELWSFAMSLCGFVETGLQPEESIIDWAQWVSMVGSAWTHISLAQRIMKGQVYRPHLLAFADEDVTGAGVEWLPVLMGDLTTLPTPTFPPIPDYGRIQGVGGTQTNPPIFFSIVDKACHADPRANQFMVAPPGTGTALYHSSTTPPASVKDLVEVVDDIKVHALASAVTTINPAPPRLFSDPNLEADQAFDDAFFRRIAMREPQNPTGSNPGLFVQDDPEDPWNPRDPMKIQGNGTMLGRHESVVVYNQCVYVGNADGFVSCLALDPVQGANLVTLGKSKDLGYATHGLAIGTLGGVDRLVVATYRGLHLIAPTPAAGILQVVNETLFDQSTTLHSMFVKPTKLVIAPYQGANHIFCRTLAAGSCASTPA